MPSRPKQYCRVPGCPNLVDRGNCADHGGPQLTEGRESAARRGYDRRHQWWRLRVLARDPICVNCQAAQATEADHIMPIARGGARLDLDNGQGLCKPCHSKKTAGLTCRTARKMS